MKATKMFAWIKYERAIFRYLLFVQHFNDYFFYFTGSFEIVSNIATFKPMKKRRDNFYSLAFLRLKHTNFFTRFRYIVKTNIVEVVL